MSIRLIAIVITSVLHVATPAVAQTPDSGSIATDSVDDSLGLFGHSVAEAALGMADRYSIDSATLDGFFSASFTQVLNPFNGAPDFWGPWSVQMAPLWLALYQQLTPSRLDNSWLRALAETRLSFAIDPSPVRALYNAALGLSVTPIRRGEAGQQDAFHRVYRRCYDKALEAAQEAGRDTVGTRAQWSCLQQAERVAVAGFRYTAAVALRGTGLATEDGQVPMCDPDPLSTNPCDGALDWGRPRLSGVTVWPVVATWGVGNAARTYAEVTLALRYAYQRNVGQWEPHVPKGTRGGVHEIEAGVKLRVGLYGAHLDLATGWAPHLPANGDLERASGKWWGQVLVYLGAGAYVSPRLYMSVAAGQWLGPGALNLFRHDRRAFFSLFKFAYHHRVAN